MNLTHDQLWDAQLVHFPDSVRVSTSDALNWPDEPVRPTEEEMRTLLDYVCARPLQREVLRSIQGGFVAARVRERRWRWVAYALADGPVVFYQCGRTDDGNYRWRGARYGLDGPDYLSNYPDDYGTTYAAPRPFVKEAM